MLRIGQVESSATADGKYTDGSVAGGIAATRLRAAAFNAIQEELANIVESAGMTLDPDDVTQVLAALKNQFLSRVNPFADIKADGSAAVAAALSNLGLEEIAKAGVGTGFLSGNGYMKIPLIISGLKVEGIIQWGTALVTAKTTAGQETTQISFPVKFPSSCLQVVATHDDPNGSNALFSVGDLGSGSFWASVYKLTANGAGKAVIAIDGSASLRYIVIGY